MIDFSAAGDLLQSSGIWKEVWPCAEALHLNLNKLAVFGVESVFVTSIEHINDLSYFSFDRASDGGVWKEGGSAGGYDEDDPWAGQTAVDEGGRGEAPLWKATALGCTRSVTLFTTKILQIIVNTAWTGFLGTKYPRVTFWVGESGIHCFRMDCHFPPSQCFPITC